MNTEIRLVAEFTIAEGKTDAFKELIKTAIEKVRSNEPDTLTYEFYFSDDETKCYALELYRDSQAVLTHMEDVSELLQKILAIAQLTSLEIYGDATAELKEALASFGSKFFTHWSGFKR